MRALLFILALLLNLSAHAAPVANSMNMTATGQSMTLDVSMRGYLSVQVTSLVGALVVDGTSDMATYVSLTAMTSACATSTSITADGLYAINVGTLTTVRVRAATISSGTAAVFMGIGSAPVYNCGAVGSSALPSGAATAARQDAMFGALTYSTSVGYGINPNTGNMTMEEPMGTGSATFTAAFVHTTPASGCTDFAVLVGSPTKTIILTDWWLSGAQTTAGQRPVALLRRSSADTGGALLTMTAVTSDTANAVATAAAYSFTANPTTGTLVGALWAEKLYVPTVLLPGGTNAYKSGSPGFSLSQPIILRGVAQSIAINLSGVAGTGEVFTGGFKWKECTGC